MGDAFSGVTYALAWLNTDIDAAEHKVEVRPIADGVITEDNLATVGPIRQRTHVGDGGSLKKACNV